MTRIEVFSKLIQSAYDFYEMALWEFFESDNLFAINAPGAKHTIFVTIFGQAGMEFGINIIRGANALRDWRLMYSEDVTDDGVYDSINLLGYGMSQASELPPKYFNKVKRVRKGLSQQSDIPFFMVKEPGKNVRLSNQKEEELLLYVINGIIKAYNNSLLTPGNIGAGDKIFTLNISGDKLDPDVAAEVVHYSEVVQLDSAEPLLRPEGLEELPILDARWLIGLPIAPMRITNDDRTVRGVLVVDEITELIIFFEVIMGEDIEKAAFLIFNLFKGNGNTEHRGIPREISFISYKLFTAVSPLLKPLGIECSYDKDNPVIRNIMIKLEEELERNPM